MTRKTICRLCLLLAVGLCLGFVAADQVTAGNACGCINGCSLIDCHCTACACGGDFCGCASWGSKCPAQACGGNTVTKNCECGGEGCSNVCPSKTFCAPNVQSPFKPCGGTGTCVSDGCAGLECGCPDTYCKAAGIQQPCGGTQLCNCLDCYSCNMCGAVCINHTSLPCD